MPKPDKNEKPNKPGKPDRDDVPKVDDDRQPVTDPARSHRVSLKTLAGPLITKAMPEESARVLDSLIEQHSRGSDPIISIGLPDGDWRLNTQHVTAWQVVPNLFDKLA